MNNEKKEFKERKDIPTDYTWDLESMYKDEKAWEDDLNDVLEKAEDFEVHKSKVGESSKTLLNVLTDLGELYRKVYNVYSYANMKLDEDTRVGDSQALYDRGFGAYIKVQEKTSFVTPEILQLDETTIDEYLNQEEGLQEYSQYLDNILRNKDHVLSSQEESILAQMGEISNSPEQIYGMLNNADIKFPTIKDEDGNDVEITQGNFIPLMESKNRQVRKDAFENLYNVYESFKNTFAQSLSGNTKANITNARIRKHNSAMEASLSENNIPISVYDNLLDSVNRNLDSMYKYMGIRKRALGLDELHMYDLYTPIVKDTEFKITYEEGQDLILKGLEPLKDEYLSIVKEGFNSRWIDVYENKGKRSGAYSSGSYDSKPFILTNYHDTLDNVSTVAHEMGHSVHSYLSNKYQTFINSNYSIFLAEIASTTNELLLLDYMMKNVKDKNEKLYLLNNHLEQFRTTVFRQTMFAEFEKNIYEYAESGGALTADYLCDTYKKLNEKYYGPDVVADDEIAIEWARIPHFYYNFYVYQYATGYSIATEFSQQILNEGDSAVERYLTFLKSGCSDYPINVLKTAGIDITTGEPVDNALNLFKNLVDEMDELI